MGLRRCAKRAIETIAITNWDTRCVRHSAYHLNGWRYCTWRSVPLRRTKFKKIKIKTSSAIAQVVSLGSQKRGLGYNKRAAVPPPPIRPLCASLVSLCTYHGKNVALVTVCSLICVEARTGTVDLRPKR